MPNELTKPRIRPDKEAVARLFNVPVSAMQEFIPNYGGRGFSTIAIHCRHPRTIDLDLGIARGLPNHTVWPDILMDEHGVFYGFAGQCICGKVFYIPPTIELLELAESMAQATRPRLTP